MTIFIVLKLNHIPDFVIIRKNTGVVGHVEKEIRIIIIHVSVLFYKQLGHSSVVCQGLVTVQPAIESVNVNTELGPVQHSDWTIYLSGHEFPEMIRYIVFRSKYSLWFVKQLACNDTDWHLNPLRVVAVDKLSQFPHW